MKTINKITCEGKNLSVERRIPEIGEYWVYIGFNEPFELVLNNLPKSWFSKLWDIENYYTVIHP